MSLQRDPLDRTAPAVDGAKAEAGGDVAGWVLAGRSGWKPALKVPVWPCRVVSPPPWCLFYACTRAQTEQSTR